MCAMVFVHFYFIFGHRSMTRRAVLSKMWSNGVLKKNQVVATIKTESRFCLAL